MDEELSKRLAQALERRDKAQTKRLNETETKKIAEAEKQQKRDTAQRDWLIAKNLISAALASVNSAIGQRGIEFREEVLEHPEAAIAAMALRLVDKGEPARVPRPEIKLNISGFGKGQARFPSSTASKEFDVATATQEFYQELMIELLETTYPA